MPIFIPIDSQTLLPTRDMPARIAPPPRIAAIVLAAGRSSRMGRANKLLLEIAGQSMLEHVLAALDGAALQEIIVVTGHQAEQVQARLERRTLTLVHNPDYRQGLSTSLRCGLASLAADVDAALICLADMPRVRATQISQLIHAFDPAAGRAICAPLYQGKRGNPILWGSHFFEQMKTCHGDVGAKSLLAEHNTRVCEVPVDDAGVLLDCDTRGDLVRLGGA